MISLDAQARELLEKAASSGRGARTLVGGRDSALRQTLMALKAGAELAEHESPGEATLLVLSGRVRLSSGDESWEVGAGEIVPIPRARHALEALEDATALLTITKLP